MEAEERGGRRALAINSIEPGQIANKIGVRCATRT